MQLQRTHYEQILRHCLSEAPNEACGAVAGEGARPVKVFPAANAEASPDTYQMDSREQLRIWNEMEEQGWEPLALYHSHTHSEAYPSETDRKQAFFPESVYLVLSVADQEAPVLRAFHIADGEVTEEEEVNIG